MDATAGEFVDEPAVDGATRELPSFRGRPAPLTWSKIHANFVALKVRVEQEAGFLADHRFAAIGGRRSQAPDVRRSCQTIAW